MKKTWRSGAVILFCCIIMLPLLLQGISATTGKKLDVHLNGYFEEYEKPLFRVDSFISGDYQQEYEKWLNANVMPRGAYIKLYNQIRYSFFDLGSQIIGKNKDLFEEGYITNELCLAEICNYSNLENQEKISNYVRHLENIQRKLEEMGKTFLVYTSPMKTEYMYNDIPTKYMIQKPKESGLGRDYFRQLIEKTEVNCFFADDVIQKKSIQPVFYTTGIHWSRVAEQQVSVSLLEQLRELSGKKFRNIELGELQVSETPYWRDADLYELLNLYTDADNELYYEYDSYRQFPEKYDSMKMLLQGGSFAEGLEKDYFGKYANEELYYINYDNYIQEPNGEIHTFEVWGDLELDRYLDIVDCIVIEINDAQYHQESNGFVEYLDAYLDYYKSKKSEDKKMPNEKLLDCKNLSEMQQEALEFSKGIGYFENGMAWSGDNVVLRLKNENIGTEGLELELGIAEQAIRSDAQEIVIYLNQKKVKTCLLETAGKVDICIEPDTFDVSSDGLYEIEIYSKNIFNPKKLGESMDNRDLAIGIYYVGEKR